LWLVANRHLPYEAVLDQGFGQVRTVAQEHGFKIVEASKTTAKATTIAGRPRGAGAAAARDER